MESFLNKLIVCSNNAQTTFLKTSRDFDIRYQKTVLRDNTLSLSLQNEVDFYYICFVKSFDEVIYKLDDDASKPSKINFRLNENEDMFKTSTLECVKQCIAKKHADRKFSLFAFVSIH